MTTGVNTTNYQLKRSKRTTLAIYIEKDGTVTVRAPYSTPTSYIDSFVSQKSGWIEKHVNNIEKRRPLEYGDKMYLLGQQYPILSSDVSLATFDGSAFLLPSGLGEKQLKDSIDAVLKDEANKYLKGRFFEVARLCGFNVTSVKVTSATTRWGSCSPKNWICLSFRLIAAPQGLIDYVIIHELCHTIQHNHSKKFWKAVESFLPNYKDLRRSLNEFSKNALSMVQ